MVKMFCSDFQKRNLVVFSTNGFQFLVVLTHMLVVADTGTCEFCRPAGGKSTLV